MVIWGDKEIKRNDREKKREVKGARKWKEREEQ